MNFLEVLTDRGIEHVNAAHIVSLRVESSVKDEYDRNDNVVKVYNHSVLVVTTAGGVRQRYSNKEAAEAGLDEMLIQLTAMPAATEVW